MFAQFTVKAKSKNNQSLGLSALYFTIDLGKVQRKVELEELHKIVIEKRKKLAPLIAGGIITSLSLLSMVLYSSSFEIIGLIAFGLLLIYVGIIEYTVLRLEYANTNELVWLPLSVSLEAIRPFIAIVEFYLGKRQFPVLFATPVAAEDHNLIHYESSPVPSHGTIIYQFGESSAQTIPQVPVNPALLDHTIEIEGQGKVIGEGHYLINHQAIVDITPINLS